MGQIFNAVQVGNGHGDLIPLLDGKLGQTEVGRHRGHIDTHLVAVTNNHVVGFQGNAIFLGSGDSRGEVGIITLPDLLGLNLVASDDHRIVRLGKSGGVMQ